uniref:F-box domain-containing protein n=1 Tax=Oryza punctata TaxID=4537 RepID=A0A0E0LWB2_ORYPU
MEEEEEVSFGDLPADALEKILLGFPPSARRRLRLGCRHWRDAIDESMPETRSRSKTLVFINSQLSLLDYSQPASAAAYGLDDLVEGQCREVWRSAAAAYLDDPSMRTRMIGTCNGLLCLYDEPASNIVLLNPTTGETQWSIRWTVPKFIHAAFSFAYLETTGQYKIVHLRVERDLVRHRTRWALPSVEVLTLGEDVSWKNVKAPAGTSCNPYSGIVSVDGATHWISNDWKMLMSFDLTDERFVRGNFFAAGAAVTAPSRLPEGGGRDARGHRRRRLRRQGQSSEAFLSFPVALVWAGGVGARARRRRTTAGPDEVAPPGAARRLIELGHMISCAPWGFGQGEHVLTKLFGSLYAHPCVSGAGAARPQCSVCSVVRIDDYWPRIKPVFTYDPHRSMIHTFSFVETTEPLNIHHMSKR